jgi:hypothetical protein
LRRIGEGQRSIEQHTQSNDLGLSLSCISEGHSHAWVASAKSIATLSNLEEAALCQTLGPGLELHPRRPAAALSSLNCISESQSSLDQR